MLLLGEMEGRERRGGEEEKRVSGGPSGGEMRQERERKKKNNGEETDGEMTPVLIGVLMDTAVGARVSLSFRV